MNKTRAKEKTDIIVNNPAPTEESLQGIQFIIIIIIIIIMNRWSES